MATAIRISGDEMAALAGLPHIAIVIYLLGIRPRMDFANGTVGEKPLISWQALRESAFVEPHQGVKHEYASVSGVRRAVGWLEKAGLVQLRSRERQLVFYLPLAHADYSARKKADKGPADLADKGPADQKAGKSTRYGNNPQKSRQTKVEKADKHPVSGKPITPPSPPAPDTSASSLECGRAGGGPNFIYPRGFTQQQKIVAAELLQGLADEIGQSILDELDAARMTGTVRNMPALLKHFVAQAHAGDFLPDKGVAVRRGREAEARRLTIEAELLAKANQAAAKVVALRGRPHSAMDALREAQRQRFELEERA